MSPRNARLIGIFICLNYHKEIKRPAQTTPGVGPGGGWVGSCSRRVGSDSKGGVSVGWGLRADARVGVCPYPKASGYWWTVVSGWVGSCAPGEGGVGAL